MNLSHTLASLRERIQQRIEGRPPDLPDFRAPSLDTLAGRHRKAADWSALVGTVNPRPRGLHNAVIQWAKRLMARALRWHGHPQREFNRSVLEALAETQLLFADQNRNMLVLAQAAAQAGRDAHTALAEVGRLCEMLESWKQEMQNELREQGRRLDGRIIANVTRLDADLLANVARLNEAVNTVQESFWKDFAAHREEHAALHRQEGARLEEEVRLVRQRLRSLTAGTSTAASSAAPPAAPSPAVPAFDYSQFERRFRGTEEEIRRRQSVYVPFFEGRAPVLDVACGRGEFLGLLREKGIEARGVDLDPDMVARCREQNLDAAQADAFTFLEALPDGSLGGMFSAQFIEHLSTPEYVRLIELAYRKLRAGGALLLETQNPECLAIFSQSFFVDPTHVRPAPAAQLRFWMEEAGFRDLATHYVSPVAPALPQLPLLEAADSDGKARARVERWNLEAQRFNRTYFGFQDYAVLGIKP